MKLKNDESKSIKKQLLYEMKNGIYANQKRLPRETILAESMHVSRTQLRDALSALESEGFITRLQGIGTIINHHVLQVKNRMDIETEFLDIIRQNGYEPSVSFIDVSEGWADEKTAEKLHIRKETEIIRIRLLCSADGKPAIYTEDVLEKRLVKRDYRSEEFHVNVFQFLSEFCDLEPYMDLTELHPALPDERLADILKVPAGKPLLNMEEVDYDFEGNPLFYSNQYFVDEFFKHTVLRKKF